MTFFTPFGVLLSSCMPPFVTQMPSSHQNTTAVSYQLPKIWGISEDHPSIRGYCKDCLPAQTHPNKPNASPKWRDDGSLAKTMIGPILLYKTFPPLEMVGVWLSDVCDGHCQTGIDELHLSLTQRWWGPLPYWSMGQWLATVDITHFYSKNHSCGSVMVLDPWMSP